MKEMREMTREDIAKLKKRCYMNEFNQESLSFIRVERPTLWLDPVIWSCSQFYRRVLFQKMPERYE